ncbi:hypothetical protein GCM10023149_31240 [Mucilaginibacter gynuensis]|uniref:Uncharacterized protein n=1 Tax=Mucilaginibacter gynuensis TaxID=1302236 RepID=A0ABP8GNT8_9SPHI
MRNTSFSLSAFLGFISIFFFSCQSNSGREITDTSNVLRINIDPVGGIYSEDTLSSSRQIFDSVKYIALETNDKSLFSSIQ